MSNPNKSKYANVDLRTYHAIARDLAEALPDHLKCSVVAVESSNTLLMRLRDTARGRDLVLHNFTPGLLLLNRERLLEAIVNGFTTLLNSDTSTSISMFEFMVYDPLVEQYHTTYPMLTSKNLEQTVRANLHEYSRTHPQEFPMRELAYRIHAMNPFSLVSEGPSLEDLKSRFTSREQVDEELPKLMVYNDVMQDGAPILLSKIPLEIEVAEGGPAPDSMAILRTEVARLALRTLGTVESRTLNKAVVQNRVRKLTAEKSIPSHMELAFAQAKVGHAFQE